jgi:hypothetical protein
MLRNGSSNQTILSFFLLKSWTFFTKEPHNIGIEICKRVQYMQCKKGSFLMKQGDMTDRNTNTRYVYFLLTGTLAPGIAPSLLCLECVFSPPADICLCITYQAH